jgi:hypothetical protein
LIRRELVVGVEEEAEGMVTSDTGCDVDGVVCFTLEGGGTLKSCWGLLSGLCRVLVFWLLLLVVGCRYSNKLLTIPDGDADSSGLGGCGAAAAALGGGVALVVGCGDSSLSSFSLLLLLLILGCK